MKANKTQAYQSYTWQQTQEAIKKSKPFKALGLDKISNLHLKLLGLGSEILDRILQHQLFNDTPEWGLFSAMCGRHCCTAQVHPSSPSASSSIDTQ